LSTLQPPRCFSRRLDGLLPTLQPSRCFSRRLDGLLSTPQFVRCFSVCAETAKDSSVLHRSPADLAIPLAGFLISIKNTPPMPHVMLPCICSDIGTTDGYAIDVYVSVDICVHPVMVPIPVTPCKKPGWAHHAKKGERKYNPRYCISRRIIPERRIIGIPPRPINYGGVINRYINHIRIYGLDHNGIPLRNHLLLFAGLQVVRFLGLFPQFLDRIHHGILLAEEGISELLGPLQLLAHHGQDLRERNQGLYAGIPIMLVQFCVQLIALETFGLPNPTVCHYNLEGIRGGHQDLGQQRIGIQGNRRQHLIQFRLR
jgi:hypothetical protein